DLRAAVVGLAVDLLELEQLFLDHAVDTRRIAQNRAELRDALPQIVELGLNLLARELRQPGKAKVEDRLSLDLRQVEVAHQPGARIVCVGGAADERDDGVERVERLEITLEDVCALLCLPQLVF